MTLAALMVLAGLSASVYGLWLAWAPLGWVVGGLVAAAAGALGVQVRGADR